MMSMSIRFTACSCVLLAVVSVATAKQYVLRYDVVEVEYAEGDIDRTGEPSKTTTRHIEVKIDEKREFSSTRVDQGWDLTVSGKATGLKDGRLRVEGLMFAYGSTDRNAR